MVIRVVEISIQNDFCLRINMPKAILRIDVVASCRKLEAMVEFSRQVFGIPFIFWTMGECDVLLLRFKYLPLEGLCSWLHSTAVQCTTAKESRAKILTWYQACHVIISLKFPP